MAIDYKEVLLLGGLAPTDVPESFTVEDVLNEFWSLPVPEEGFPEGSIGEQWNRFRSIGDGVSAMIPLPLPENSNMAVVAFYAGDFGANKTGVKFSLEIEDDGPIFINQIFQNDKKQEEKTRLVIIDDVSYARAAPEVFPSSVLVANGYSGIYVAKWDNGPKEGRRIRVPDEGGNLKSLTDAGV